jgi:DNA-binding MarR family transcriptional regulator
MMTALGDLKLSDYQAIAEFRYQIRRFLRFSEEAAVQVGLEPQQHQALLAVQGMPLGGRARIADIAERLQIRHHSAVELVSRMVDKGLIQRVQGKSDRREVSVRLSPRGSRILQALTVSHRDELRRAAPVLVETLSKLTRPMRANDGQAKTHSSVSRPRVRPVAAERSAV